MINSEHYYVLKYKSYLSHLFEILVFHRTIFINCLYFYCTIAFSSAYLWLYSNLFDLFDIFGVFSIWAYDYYHLVLQLFNINLYNPIQFFLLKYVAPIIMSHIWCNYPYTLDEVCEFFTHFQTLHFCSSLNKIGFLDWHFLNLNRKLNHKLIRKFFPNTIFRPFILVFLYLLFKNVIIFQKSTLMSTFLHFLRELCDVCLYISVLTLI